MAKLSARSQGCKWGPNGPCLDLVGVVGHPVMGGCGMWEMLVLGWG